MGDLLEIAAARDEWLRVLTMSDDVVRAEAATRLTTCRAALEIVDARLADIGYPVHPIVRSIDRDHLDEVQRTLAEADIALPPLLALVWQIVGSVSVLEFGRYRHVSFWSDRIGPTEACTDGLHIDAPGDDDYESFVDYLIDEREGWLDSGLADEGEPFEFPIAPDDLHKDNVSGGDPYGLAEGSGTWDHRVTQFAWRCRPVSAPDGAPDLLSYLRTAILECGCFPGFFGVAAYEPDRQYLTADLPIF